jgi:ribokinase
MPPKRKTFDLIAIGESLRDVFYHIDEATISCSLKKDACLICLAYADKIPVKHIVKVPAAGNSSNAAVGAARLGLHSALVTWTGADRAAFHMREALNEEGVDLRFLIEDEKHPTSEATILTFQGEKTQLVNFQPRKYRLPRLPSTDCIYYSAVGASHDMLDRQIHMQLKRHLHTHFVFQPGTTHVRQGIEKIRVLISQSSIFILNKEESHLLLGDGDRSVLYMLEAFHALGAKTVVITDGKNGAEAYDGKDHWSMPVFPGKPIETTGAGDSFATGMTVAMLRGEDLPTSLRWGTANSWSVIHEIGPQKGLLDVRGMQRVLKKFASIKPTKLN